MEGGGEGIDWISERINETDKGRKYVSLERGFSGDEWRRESGTRGFLVRYLVGL